MRCIYPYFLVLRHLHPGNHIVAPVLLITQPWIYWLNWPVTNHNKPQQSPTSCKHFGRFFKLRDLILTNGHHDYSRCPHTGLNWILLKLFRDLYASDKCVNGLPTAYLDSDVVMMINGSNWPYTLHSVNSLWPSGVLHHDDIPAGRSPKVIALFSATNCSSYIIELLQLHDTIPIKWKYAWIHYNLAIRSHLVI